MSEPYKKTIDKKFDDIESLENIRMRMSTNKEEIDNLIEIIVKEIKITLYLAYKEKWKRGELK